MSTLTSLLVRDQVVSIRAIEEAIQRQVISGGDLPSVLLEMGAISENTLVSYLAAQFGLAPAGREEVMSIPGAILENVRPDLAIEKRILPIGETAGRLLIASARPLRGDERRELGFAIGHAIELRITLDLRIAAGLHRHYGETLGRREQRLLRKIDAAAPGELREVAPLDPNRSFGRDRDEDERDESEERPLAPTRFSHEDKANLHGSALAAGSTIDHGGGEAPRPAARAERKSSDPALAAQPIEPLSAPRPTSSLIERHRGPLTAKRAAEMLAKAETRDEILAIAMAFIRQFFDYTALFVVHDEEAEGLDSYGSGLDYRAIQKLSVRLESASAFGKTREERLPRIAHLGGEESEREFIAKTKRANAQPSLIAPIAIEHRVILILYADREGEELSISDIPEVIGFLPRIGAALKHLILRRKGQAMRSDLPPPAAVSTASGPGASNPIIQGGADSRGRDERSPDTYSRAEDGARRRPRFAVPLELPKAPPRERSRTLELLGIAREEPSLPDFATLLAARQEDERKSQKENQKESELRISAPERQARQNDTTPEEKEPGGGGTSASQRIPRIGRPAGAEPSRSRSPSHPSERAHPPSSSRGSGDMPAPAPLKRRVRVSERPMPTVHKGGEDRVEIIDTSSISADLSSLRSLPPPPRAGKEAPIPEERSSLDSKESKAILARIKSRPSAVSTIPLGREHLPSEPPAGARSSVAVEHDGSVEAKVEALVNMRPSEASALIREIVAAGAKRALAPLVRAFPGQLFFLRSVGPLPRPNEISSVALAIAAFGAEAEEAIADLLSHPSGDIRYYALAIAKGALTPAVAVALTALLRDEDRELRRQALELLRSISAGDPARAHAADALVHKASDPSANSDERALSLDALGILGAIEVSERLALYLEDTDATIAGSARGALITIFADDRGPSRAAWQALLDARAHKHRIEFLIEGLLHENETIRREAGAELQRLSREYLGYHAGLPRRERELLKRRYEEWWEERGRARFLGHGGV